MAVMVLFGTASAYAQQTQTTSITAGTAHAPVQKHTATTAVKVKKDGTPDKRFKANKHLKKDGTPDRRYKN